MVEEQGNAQQTTGSPAQAISSDLTGTTLGKYRLVEKLGQGGMAQVYKAYQPDLDRYVAIKILHPHLTGDAEFATRARAFANWLKSPEYLSGHPNIFTFDFFNLLAESNTGARDYNMLRAAYRADPNDSHPNERANREIGPQFADFIDRAIKTYGK